jgi:hypothetical protein
MWVMAYGMCGSFLARVAGKYYRNPQNFASSSERQTTKTLPRICSGEGLRLTAGLVLVFLPLHIFPLFPLVYTPITIIWDASLAVKLFFGACAVVWAFNFRRTTLDAGRVNNLATMPLVSAALVWFCGLAAVGLYLDPANVQSLSVHQPFGGRDKSESALCEETETYLFGLPGAVRKKYICEEDFRFWRLCEDKPRPRPGDETYWICGTPGDESFWREYFSSIAIGLALHVLCWWRGHGGGKENKNIDSRNVKLKAR